MSGAFPAENKDVGQALLLPWWGLQLLAWTLYCVVSFLSLTLWYGDPEWLHVLQILLEALSGALLILPLGWSIGYIDKWNVISRFCGQFLIVAALAFGWNVLRMSLFQTFFPQAQIWNEFGGWYFASILIFALWTTLHYIVRANNAAEEERERAQSEHLLRVTAESLSRDAQLQMLRYQINPHFIFNSMNSINALVATDRPKEARKMIDLFCDFLRVSLEDGERLFVPLEYEMETARRYLEVEKMRFRDRVSFAFDIDDDGRKIMVPSLILQPILENAIRYGVEGQSEACAIKIHARLSGERLIIEVSDTGPGLGAKEHDDDRPHGLGLKNVRARLQTAYGDNFSFDIRGNDGGVTVTIAVPQLHESGEA